VYEGSCFILPLQSRMDSFEAGEFITLKAIIGCLNADRLLAEIREQAHGSGTPAQRGRSQYGLSALTSKRVCHCGEDADDNRAAMFAHEVTCTARGG
jgi:hypothetical protein